MEHRAAGYGRDSPRNCALGRPRWPVLVVVCRISGPGQADPLCVTYPGGTWSSPLRTEIADAQENNMGSFGLVAVALIAAACGSSSTTAAKSPGSPSAAVSAASSAPASASSSGTVLKTTTIGGVTVLTSATGFTLYSFVPDTAARSNCNGACAAYWPPVKGGGRGPRRYRHAHDDHPFGRVAAGRLRRASAVHLRR